MLRTIALRDGKTCSDRVQHRTAFACDWIVRFHGRVEALIVASALCCIACQLLLIFGILETFEQQRHVALFQSLQVRCVLCVWPRLVQLRQHNTSTARSCIGNSSIVSSVCLLRESVQRPVISSRCDVMFDSLTHEQIHLLVRQVACNAARHGCSGERSHASGFVACHCSNWRCESLCE